ncbi:MAG: alpha-galactosidase [Candidatus Latescibacterota bacterium]
MITKRTCDMGILGDGVSPPPFSFVYSGKASAEFLATWTVADEQKELDGHRTQRTRTWTDPETGLIVCCEAIFYSEFSAAEWIVHFRNGSPHDTPILESIQALDMPVTGHDAGPVVLHHAKGSDATFSDYRPLSDPLEPNARLLLHSHGVPTSWGEEPSGSPSVEALPFFNIEVGGQGMIAAVGWTGPWFAEFARDTGCTVTVRAGMDRTRLRLRPGEQIRSPRILVLHWNDDRMDAHNQWRRLLLEHYSPRPGGKVFDGLLANAVWGSWMPAEEHIAEINWWSEHQVPMACYWMDAGWCGDMKNLGWAAHQSDRRPNKELFPNGMRPVSDAAHHRGMEFLLWFVPESIHPAVEIGQQRPDWLSEPFENEAYGDNIFYGLDHGDPEVNAFMIDYYSSIISEYGVDVFRQDGLHLWPRETDADRQGIDQIRYNEGFYVFWDGLLQRHPDLLIDNCGCGGRKLDLETVRRSILLWRSDCQASGDFDPMSSQGFTYGLSFWIPLYGGAAPMGKWFGRYSMRSGYGPAMMLSWPGKPREFREGMDVDLLRKLLNEYLQVRPYFLGDYYPLTPYSLEQDTWMAWQFDRPDLGEGMVQAFRRTESPDESACYPLRGLDPDAEYGITDLDAGTSWQTGGRELMNLGVPITLKNRPDAGIFVYKKGDFAEKGSL